MFNLSSIRCFLAALAIMALSSCAFFQEQEPAEVAASDEKQETAELLNQMQEEVDSAAPQTILGEFVGPPVFTPEQQAELEELPQPETDLWELIVDGYHIPDLHSPVVEKWEKWYSSRPTYLLRMLDRSRLYMYHIVHEVRARSMPMEIALLPMVESAFNPNALSSARASGIWQFIPSTGKSYGLKQNWWVDERRDVVSATNSALDYLQKLHGDFNDWQLALAAYNWGEGSVSRALARNKASRLPQKYESLKMPKETANYIPKLQALKNIIRDPEKFNLELPDMPDAPYFTVVKTTKKMDVNTAASLAEMSRNEFRALNPQHNRPVIAGADEFSILLPINKAELFAAKLELTEQPLVTWQAHRLQKGETLANTASKFGMSVEALRAINGLGRRAKVREGMVLLVPAQQPSWMAEATLANSVLTTVPIARVSYYKIKSGDTLTQIALRHGTTTDELIRLNGLKNANNLRVGKSIRVYNEEVARATLPVSRSCVTTARSTSHKVQKGDTLSGIASRYQVSVQDLIHWNCLSHTKVRAGKKLWVSEQEVARKTAKRPAKQPAKSATAKSSTPKKPTKKPEAKKPVKRPVPKPSSRQLAASKQK